MIKHLLLNELEFMFGNNISLQVAMKYFETFPRSEKALGILCKRDYFEDQMR